MSAWTVSVIVSLEVPGTSAILMLAAIMFSNQLSTKEYVDYLMLFEVQQPLVFLKNPSRLFELIKSVSAKQTHTTRREAIWGNNSWMDHFPSHFEQNSPMRNIACETELNHSILRSSRSINYYYNHTSRSSSDYHS